MNAVEAWARTEELFGKAVELAPPERVAFVERSCSGDAALQREIERLLAAHDSAGKFLESLDPVRGAALLRAAPPEVESIPESIGSYRVVRRLGSGGMGVVYSPMIRGSIARSR